MDLFKRGDVRSFQVELPIAQGQAREHALGERPALSGFIASMCDPWELNEIEIPTEGGCPYDARRTG